MEKTNNVDILTQIRLVINSNNVICNMTILVAAAVIQKNGKFLIAKRASHKHLAGFWEFPGGKIEPNESAEDCLIRELYEELRIKVKIVHFLAKNIHDYGTMRISLSAYLCSFVDGDFTLVDHDEIRWVAFSEIGQYNLAPADIPLLKAIENINIFF